ncbi:MAG: Lysine-sensitive aspartokinase 3 [Flavobacteriaceae bacterium]|nr:MAG: Lysine-sensitive aspartokinase 3 [Flavobacteriaceae bacterium]
MKIFKFGGASVKDANGVKNILNVLKHTGFDNTLIVVSAMGKTTNALERVVSSFFENKVQFSVDLELVRIQHHSIIKELYDAENKVITDKVNALFDGVLDFLKTTDSEDYSWVYDQVVSLGELVSTTIISDYMQSQDIDNTWLDARKCIKTDAYYRDANLYWTDTEAAIQKEVAGKRTLVSQGFIASAPNGDTTTLGREGSDYSAAIFAYALGADSVTIWKDVPGVLNGDPRKFDDTVLLHQISYREAIELAFYGASVIHPKTLQPLQRKEIPLYVKSFENPENPGTAVSKGKTLDPMVPCYIVKENQTLLKLSSKDFSFIVEDNISEIFALLHQFKMRVEMIQSSAISFSICILDKYSKLEHLLEALNSKFKVEVNDGVSLYTIRHFDKPAINFIKNAVGEILVEQRTTNTAQFVVRD